MGHITAKADHVPLGGLLRPAESTTSKPRTESPEHGWRALNRFGLLLVIVGLVDMALVWYPLQVGNPTWEFAAVGLSFSTLPLLTIGFAAILGSALATGKRRRVQFISAGLILFALLFLGLFAFYLTTVPIALKMAPAIAATGVKKAIVRTSVLAIAFSAAYLISGVAALRFTRSTRGGGHV